MERQSGRTKGTEQSVAQLRLQVRAPCPQPVACPGQAPGPAGLGAAEGGFQCRTDPKTSQMPQSSWALHLPVGCPVGGLEMSFFKKKAKGVSPPSHPEHQGLKGSYVLS